MLWGLGNYSQNEKNFLFLAYKNQNNGKVGVVLVNSGYEDVNITLEMNSEEIADFDSYVTSSGKDLEKAELALNNGIVIPKRAITTTVYSM